MLVSKKKKKAQVPLLRLTLTTSSPPHHYHHHGQFLECVRYQSFTNSLLHGLFKAGFTARAGPRDEGGASRHIINLQTESVPSDTVLATFSFWPQQV